MTYSNDNYSKKELQFCLVSMNVKYHDAGAN